MRENKNPVGGTAGSAIDSAAGNGRDNQRYYIIFGAVARRLINGQDVDQAYIAHLPDAWQGVIDAIRVTPHIADQRARALGVAVSDLPERDTLLDAVFRSDGTEDLAGLARATAKRHVITAYDALQPLDPIGWLVGDLITESSVNIWYGAPGSRKTWAALDMMVAVSRGEPWLRHATTAAPTLLIDEESGWRRISNRLGMVLRGHDANGTEPITVHTMMGYDLRDAQHLDHLVGAIRNTGAQLVVVDALVDVMLGGDENAVKDVQPLMHGIRWVADETGAAIVLIHHSNKAGGYRGSTALSAAADCMVQITSKGNVVEFETTKARDSEMTSFRAAPTWHDGAFWLSSMDTPLLPAHLQAALEYVMAAGGTVARKDILQQCRSRRTIDTLITQGYLRRVDDGRQGTPATLTVTDKGREYLQE